MPDTRGPKVGTLSDLAREGRHIAVWCESRDCRHHADLDPAALIERYGDVSLESLNQHLVCSRCGGREFHLLVPPGNVPFSRGWRG